MNQGAKREDYDSENPGYAAWRHYDLPSAWAQTALARLRSWGFTTVGAWSDFTTLRQAVDHGPWLTPVLHIGSTAGAPWWDMWDPENIRRMDETAREQILPLRDHPRVIGYYSDNELGWWNATLWKMTLEHPSSSGQRRRLLRLLREVYANDWQRLLADFEPEDAEDWTGLERRGMLYLRSGGQGIHTMRRFLGFLAGRYYELMREIIQRHDPGALYLGDRYQSFYYPEVARASRSYVDVSSSNLNAHWSDGTFLRCHLEALYALTGRPILVSEFYLAADENRSGNRNNRGVFPTVPTQRERADAARRTLDVLAGLPYVVGVEWFQYTDEPRHGREDGENFNFGLVDINDRPYEEVTALFASFDATSFREQVQAPRPDVASGVPPAPEEPFANFTATRALKHWDREHGFVPPSTGTPIGDLYLCWNERALFFGLYAIDIIEAAYYRHSSVPKLDRPVWTVRLNGREIVRARLGAGREPLVSDPRVRIENLSGLDLDVRNVAALEIPAALMGADVIRPGDRIELDCSLLTHCGAYRMEWKGSFVLRQ